MAKKQLTVYPHVQDESRREILQLLVADEIVVDELMEGDTTVIEYRNWLSFHSLRHTAATLLRMTGSSEAVAREIIGHDSANVDRGYVHMDASAMQ